MLFVLLSFCVDCPFKFLIYLFIYIYIYIFFLFLFVFSFIYIENGVHSEAPSCKVLYDNIKICGHIEVMPIHVC